MPPIIKVGDQPNLVPTTVFPYAKFPFSHFNPAQSRAFEFYDKLNNAVIATPTGSGKTGMAEMFMAHTVREQKKKALYLVPMRALAQEKYDDWTNINHHFGDLKVSVCTGDYRLTKDRTEELNAADVIVMSSEMLNHRMRNCKSEHSQFLKDIGVLVADECHLITVPGRGSHLESGIMKFTEHNPDSRLVLLSATMPNVAEISEWVSYALTQRETVLISSTYRPCPLHIHYEKYNNSSKKYEDNELQKIDMALQIIEYYPEDKFLVFAHTKRTGELMKKAVEGLNFSCEFHNADLGKDKRIELEKRFKDDAKFRVLVATSTLAWGCCAKGTLVSMADNTLKPIEDVLPGDFVYSMSNKGFVPSKVLRVGPKYVPAALEFVLNNGKKIVVSEEHRFYGTGIKKSIDFHEAKNLKIGDFLRCPSYINEITTSLNEFIKIVAINKSPAQEMHDIEVEKHHNYVSNGMISHNCNLPARRVILLGVHRGLDEVATYDIFQEIGRAGRPGYDPVGDAYILLPESDFDMHKARLKSPQLIKSQMLDEYGGQHKELAFHLVSEICQENIQDKDDVKHWYKRTLACFQSHDFNDVIVDKVMQLLQKCGAIWEENGKYTVTSIGKIASLFYYSPFDVADLKRNFVSLFDNNREHDDYYLSIALGNVDTQRTNIVSRVEREEMSRYAARIESLLGRGTLMEPAIKAGYIYWLLLTGKTSPILAGAMRGLQFDFPRLNQVLVALDGFTGKWGKKSFFDKLQLRVDYGVKGDMVELCTIPHIGRARANKLWAKGFRTVEDIVHNPAAVRKALGIKGQMLDEIIEGARKIMLKG